MVKVNSKQKTGDFDDSPLTIPRLWRDHSCADFPQNHYYSTIEEEIKKKKDTTLIWEKKELTFASRLGW